MQKRNVLHSPRLLELKKRRRRIFLSKILFSILAFLAVFALLAYLSRLNGLNFGKIEVGGNKIVNTEAIKRIVDKTITGNYFYFFPKTNILYYPAKNIEKELQNKFKRLENINVSVTPTTPSREEAILEISVTERKALYIWCGAIPPEIEQENKTTCYFLDKDGYIFDEAPYFSGEVYFKFYGFVYKATAEGLTDLASYAPIGSFFSELNFQKIVAFKEMTEQMGLKPAALYILSNGDVKMFLSAGKSQKRPEIIFNIDSSADILAENLQAALTTEPLK